MALGEAFSGYEDAGDYGQDRLLDEGWLSADDAQTIMAAAFKWIRLRRRIDYDHNGHATGVAALELEAALVEVFGEDCMTKHWTGKEHVLHLPEEALPMAQAPAPSQPEATVTLQGRSGPIGVDASIAPLVEALNAAGVDTVASCSGHGFRPGNIALADGRELVIARDFAEARQIDALFPLDIHGEPRMTTPAPISVLEQFDAFVARKARMDEMNYGLRAEEWPQIVAVVREALAEPDRSSVDAGDWFGLLERLADLIEQRGDRDHANDIRAGFARGTGGLDVPYLVQVLARPAIARAEEAQ